MRVTSEAIGQHGYDRLMVVTVDTTNGFNLPMVVLVMISHLYNIHDDVWLIINITKCSDITDAILLYM